MKVHYPKLYNMAHLSLNVFAASIGSNNYILFHGISTLLLVWFFPASVLEWESFSDCAFS